MPRNGSGTFTLVAGNPVVTGTTISSTVQNNTMSDIATALTASIAKDGQTTPTANLPMGGFKLTGLGAGTTTTDSTRVDAVQDSDYTYLSSVSGTNTVTASATPTPDAYKVGQLFHGISASANTGATTLNISGLGAGAVQKDGAACVGGEFKANAPFIVMVSATTPVFQLVASGAMAQVLNAILVVPGNSTQAGRIRLYEDTDNGTNYTGLAAAASISSNLDFVLPSADGSSGNSIVTNGSATLSFASRARLKTGSYTGDGSTSLAITGVGFQPTYLMIISGGADGASAAHGMTTTEMMATDAQGLILQVNAAGAGTLEDNKVLSLDADGFTVSDNSADQFPNASGVTYFYIAMRP